MEKTMKKIKLLKTDSIEELAKFWDSHAVTEFEDELVEVTEPVFVPRHSIQVRLEPRQAAAVKKLAKAKGIAEEELVRGWVLRQLAGSNGRQTGRRQPVGKGQKP
jgi:hypothetical protein